MSDIAFYHLTRSDLTKALPPLLAKTLAGGHRAVVQCGSDAAVSALDTMLWQSNDVDWLPHGTAADGDPDLQPVWLTTEDGAPNGARYLFLVDGAESPRLAEFDRVFDLFDGNNPDAVSPARQRWKAAKTAGHTLTYWQQNIGRWEKKA
jgi:DNA polymerase-3 subunit chi